MPKTNRLIGADCKLNDLQQEIERLAGGKSLKELLNKGMLVMPDGTPFIEKGHELTYEENQQRYNEPEYDALMAAKQGGVFLYTDLSVADPKPMFISGDEHKVSVTDPLSAKETNDVVRDQFEEVTEPARVARPGIFNRIKNFFKRGGTPEMNSYKQYKADLKRYNDYLAKVEATQAKVKAHGVSIAREAAKEVHTDVPQEKLVLNGADFKRRYDSMEIVPCEGEVSKVGELLEDTRKNNQHVFLGAMTHFIEDKDKVQNGLAGMTAIDLILKERVANGYVRGDERPVVPGPLEQKLNELGSEGFIGYIKENPAFKAETADMNSKKLEAYVSKNQVHTLSAKVFDDIKENEFCIKEDEPEVKQNVNEKVESMDDPSVGAIGH